MPFGSNSFMGAPSGENGGVTNLTSMNVITSIAFPMIPMKHSIVLKMGFFANRIIMPKTIWAIPDTRKIIPHTNDSLECSVPKEDGLLRLITTILLWIL